jgi:hypothetical protein
MAQKRTPRPRDPIGDLAMRLANRVQRTSDGYKLYLDGVEQSFGADMDGLARSVTAS